MTTAAALSSDEAAHLHAVRSGKILNSFAGVFSPSPEKNRNFPGFGLDSLPQEGPEVRTGGRGDSAAENSEANVHRIYQVCLTRFAAVWRDLRQRGAFLRLARREFLPASAGEKLPRMSELIQGKALYFSGISVKIQPGK